MCSRRRRIKGRSLTRQIAHIVGLDGPRQLVGLARPLVRHWRGMPPTSGGSMPPTSGGRFSGAAAFAANAGLLFNRKSKAARQPAAQQLQMPQQTQQPQQTTPHGEPLAIMRMGQAFLGQGGSEISLPDGALVGRKSKDDGWAWVVPISAERDLEASAAFAGFVPDSFLRAAPPEGAMRRPFVERASADGIVRATAAEGEAVWRLSSKPAAGAEAAVTVLAASGGRITVPSEDVRWFEPPGASSSSSSSGAAASGSGGLGGGSGSSTDIGAGVGLGAGAGIGGGDVNDGARRRTMSRVRFGDGVGGALDGASAAAGAAPEPILDNLMERLAADGVMGIARTAAKAVLTEQGGHLGKALNRLKSGGAAAAAEKALAAQAAATGPGAVQGTGSNDEAAAFAYGEMFRRRPGHLWRRPANVLGTLRFLSSESAHHRERRHEDAERQREAAIERAAAAREVAAAREALDLATAMVRSMASRQEERERHEREALEFWAACRLQRQIHKMILERSYREQMAIKLQAWARAASAARVVKHVRRQVHAALKMQRWYRRRRLDRFVVLMAAEGVYCRRAAVTLQVHCRHRRLRRRERAATRLQAWVRRWRTARVIAAVVAERTAAVVRVQSAWRSHRRAARQRMAMGLVKSYKRVAVSRLQSAARRRSAVKSMRDLRQRRLASALRLQRWYSRAQTAPSQGPPRATGSPPCARSPQPRAHTHTPPSHATLSTAECAVSSTCMRPRAPRAAPSTCVHATPPQLSAPRRVDLAPYRYRRVRLTRLVHALRGTWSATWPRLRAAALHVQACWRRQWARRLLQRMLQARRELETAARSLQRWRRWRRKERLIADVWAAWSLYRRAAVRVQAGARRRAAMRAAAGLRRVRHDAASVLQRRQRRKRLHRLLAVWRAAGPVFHGSAVRLQCAARRRSAIRLAQAMRWLRRIAARRLQANWRRLVAQRRWRAAQVRKRRIPQPDSATRFRSPHFNNSPPTDAFHRPPSNAPLHRPPPQPLPSPTFTARPFTKLTFPQPTPRLSVPC